MARYLRSGAVAFVATILPLPLFFGAPSASAAPSQEPAVRFVAAANAVHADRDEGDPGVVLDLGTHLVAGKDPFELRLTRKSYSEPIVAAQRVKVNGAWRTKALPLSLPDFTGLPAFMHVTLTDAAGKTVFDRDQTFCPNTFQPTRTRPDAPSKSSYPLGCGRLAFALGSVWGIEAGWSANTSDGTADNYVENIADGTYTAKVSVAKQYRDAFGIPEQHSSATIQVTVRTRPSTENPGLRKPSTKAGPKRLALKPNTRRPSGTPSAPKGPRPDLRALPAWSVQTNHGDPHGHGAKDQPKRDYLAFSANVWNAGNSPLVVDGFRQPGAQFMDVYQYFFDANGTETGWVPTGKMEFDSKPGHEHWHFQDFAGYRLLNEDKQEAVRSQKEAFCVLPTDEVDTTIKGANWRPFNTDLRTACGSNTALAIRQALDIGWGDTYTQDKPGQSFDITDVPNGTYYIEVHANPERKLHESNTKNNVSYRKVILGGSPGERTVTAPPFGLVDAP
jgi:hypothetical protein